MQAVAARAGWQFTGIRRMTPKGFVIDAKPCKAGAVVTNAQGMPIDGSPGKLRGHMVDVVLSVDGLWVQNGTLSVRLVVPQDNRPQCAKPPAHAGLGRLSIFGE